MTALDRRNFLAAAGAATVLPAYANGRAGKALPAETVLQNMAEGLLTLSPEQATSLGIDKGARARLRSRLGDRSPAGQAALTAQLKHNVATLDRIGTAGMDEATRVNVEVARTAFASASKGLDFGFGDVAVGSWRNTPYVVIQNVGAWLDTPRFLDSEHSVATAADAESYLARLAQFAPQLDGETARLKHDRSVGVVAPAFLLDKALAAMKKSAAAAHSGGPLVQSLVSRTASLPGDWKARAERIVTRAVAPALERQIAELSVHRARAGQDAGIWARPRGSDYYAWALATSTTTRLTPDQVHALGLEQVAALHGRMDPILRDLGYTQGSVGARMTALAKDPRFRFPEGDAGRTEILAFLQDRLAKVRAVLPRAFRTLVKGNVEVRRLPPEEEPGAPAAYGGAGSIDGSIPGKFWINLRTTDLHSRYSLPDLAHHEAIPGHVWQGEYANRMPLIRTLLAFNAYSEGWALYAEQLADELGLFDGDPVGRLGYLQSIAFRACRLVVDTGIHAKRWSREQGVAYFVETNGSNPLEVASEVDRYCSWPGQACGYKVGHNEIVRLRGQAQAALGPRYDLRDFNDAVLTGGNVPMSVLGGIIGRYVARTGGAAPA